MGRVVHFEIHAEDLDRAEAFYREVFGWRVDRWEDGDVDYRLVTTGVEGQRGIDGAIVARRGPGPVEGEAVVSWVCTVQVDALEEIEHKVPEAGGEQVVERQEIPGVGRLAYFKDTEGNIFGALQPA